MNDSKETKTKRRNPLPDETCQRRNHPSISSASWRLLCFTLYFVHHIISPDMIPNPDRVDDDKYVLVSWQTSPPGPISTKGGTAIRPRHRGYGESNASNDDERDGPESVHCAHRYRGAGNDQHSSMSTAHCHLLRVDSDAGGWPIDGDPVRTAPVT